jgi:ribonucleoside-diphosphate reductase alpha chain
VIKVVTDEQIKHLYETERQRIIALEDESEFGKNLWNYYQFVSWAKWFPDRYIELFKSKDSNMQLHFDQRVFMRCDIRFQSMYGTFSRGYAKTYNEVLDDFIVSTLNPNITLSVTAQTKENAAALLEDKTNEILNHYPLLENEIEYKRFSKNDAIVKFKNGATITNLANAQSSKGRRRHRIKIEESALLNNTLYEDALEPIVEVPRTTVGNLAIVDPEEMNFQIHFFTTSGYRGTDEYNRSVRMINGMRDLTGDIVLGSSWMLPCYYGRGSTKTQILKKKKRSNPIFFAQNYEQKWVGCSDGALIDINKLMATRILEEPVLEIQKNDEEYYIGVDVARSENTSNNQSAIVVIKAIRNPVNKRISELHIVNVLGVTNKMNFANQACLIKKIKKQYKAKMVICDGNGVGSGLIDELLRDSHDPITGEALGCFNTINTDNKPEINNAEKCLFDMKAQTYQTQAISHFINSVDSGILKMLVRKQEQDFTDKERQAFDKNVLPFVNTELLFFEIANLKLKVSGKSLSVEQVVKKIDKDKYSATLYCIFYIMEFCNQEKRKQPEDFDPSSIMQFRQPQLRKY